MKSRLVIFDLDGTLIDSFRTMEVAFSRAFSRLGLEGAAPFDGLLERQGRPLQEIVEELCLPNDMVKFYEEESERAICHTYVYPGIIDVLNDLRSCGIHMAVATGKSGNRARVIINHLRLDQYFSQVVGSGDVSRGKPDPEMVNHILRRSGHERSESILVGDAKSDIDCAERAGIFSVLATWGKWFHRDQMYKANGVANRPQEIKEYLYVGNERQKS